MKKLPFQQSIFYKTKKEVFSYGDKVFFFGGGGAVNIMLPEMESMRTVASFLQPPFNAKIVI